MSRVIQMIFFMTFFLAIYLTVNSYVILRMANLLGLNHKILLYGIIAFMTVGFPLTTWIENIMPNIFTKILYTISAYWMGVLFFLCTSLLFYEVSRLVYKINPFTAGLTILIIVFIVSIIATINAISVHVKEIQVPIKDLKHDLSIVQLTDVHIGTIRNSAFLNKIVKKVNDLDPDVVVITGDLVDGTAPLHKGMFAPFNKLRAEIYFVNGNHETYEGINKVNELFNKSKITVLDNKVVPFDGIQFVGVTYSETKNHLKTILSKLKLNESKPAILLYHAPDELKIAEKEGIDLQLSGHTHAGQIAPFNLITMLRYPRYRGLYNIGKMKLYVSPGTGTWGPYMRLGSKNEITLLKLTKK